MNPSAVKELAGENSAMIETVPFDLGEDQLTASQPFVGRWNRLVSTTNWEKGRIIQQWRDALLTSGADAAASSDDAWSQLVGGVTGQHVGRLRRVFARFGEAHSKFTGLFWSHFQAAADWDDAEMWLEGAVQSGWSVAKMRNQRWETLGRVEADRPQVGEIVTAETDEDYAIPANKAVVPEAITGSVDSISGPRHEGPDFGDGESYSTEPHGAAAFEDAEAGHSAENDETFTPPELVQPFAALPSLPVDVAEVFDHFKLVLLQHKTSGWKEISETEMLMALESLKQLCVAPA